MRIADVLQNKGGEVLTVGPGTLLAELVATLVQRNIGAVPVVDDDGRLVGIVSERDVVRRLHSGGDSVLAARTDEVMTTDVVTCTPDQSVAELAALMTTRRFRHLPVRSGDELIGIVSIGDLVKARIDALETEREQLQSYIVG